MFVNRGINDADEAPDQIDSDDEGDGSIPLASASAPGHYPIQGTIYEDLHSPEAMKLLTEEYVGLVETEIAADTFKALMARVKAILTDKKAVRSFRDLRGEIYKYMTNPKTPGMVTGFLENRYKYYLDEKTPALIEKKFDKIESFVNNKNIPKHIVFFRKMLVDFLTQPEDVRKRIAEGFTLLFTLLRLPHIPFILS